MIIDQQDQLKSPETSPEASPAINSESAAALERLAGQKEKVQQVISSELAQSSGQSLDQPSQVDEAQPEKEGRLKRISHRFNQLVVSTKTGVQQFIDRQRSQTDSVNSEKRRLGWNEVAIGVGVVAVSYLAYKGFDYFNGPDITEAAGNHNPKTGGKLNQFFDNFPQPKANSNLAEQSAEELASSLPDKTTSLKWSYQAGDMPWDVLHRAGVESPGEALTAAAEKLQRDTGTPFEWHNNHTWIEVGGKSDTKSVLDQLGPYL